jgi:predicted phage terminase large subunit-like protein
MPRKKFEDVEEVQEERKKIDEEYEGGLPDYLVDYFDEEEIKTMKRKVSEEKYSIPKMERIKWGAEKREQFWKDNRFEITKRSRRTSNPVFEESPRASERIDQERELTPEESAAYTRYCSTDLYAFAVRYFPHYLKKRSSELHRYLYNTLTREINNTKRKDGMKLAVAAPRGNAKSSIVSCIFPIWCMVYNKKHFIIMVSDTVGQAENFLADLKRELENNSRLNRDFGNICQKGPIWKADEIVTNNEVRIVALGTGSKIRGRKFGTYRPDLVICDDLENSEMVRSETMRIKVREIWFDKDFIFAGAGDSGEPDEKTDFFIVGTILGKDSLLNAILDPNQYPQWTTRRFKAVKSFSTSSLWEKWEKLYKDRFDVRRIATAREFYEEHQEEMLKGTDVLWPEGDSYYGLMVDKITSLSAFLTEKQNEGVDLSKVYVTREDLHWEDFRSGKWRIAIDRGLRRKLIFGAIDPSLGKKAKKGDYSCIMTLVRDPKTGFIFVMDIELKRRSVDDQIDAVLRLHQRYNFRLFGVETNAFQYVLAEALRKKSREGGFYVPIEEINNYQDKKMRVEGVIPFLTDGTVVFDKTKDKSNQSYNRAIEQICTFTGEDDSEDDAPDCLEMAVRIAKAPRFRMINSQT